MYPISIGWRQRGLCLILVAVAATPAALGQTVTQYGNCNAAVNSNVTCHIYGASKRDVEKLSEIVSETQVGVQEADRVVREHQEELLRILQRIADLEDRETLTQDGDPELKQQLEE